MSLFGIGEPKFWWKAEPFTNTFVKIIVALLSMFRQNLQQIQKQKMNLSPQQIQLLQFIQYNSAELDKELRDEVLDNPMLEILQDTPENQDPQEYDRTDEENNDTLTSEETGALMDRILQDDEETAEDYQLAQHQDTDLSGFPTLAESVDFRKNLQQQIHLLDIDTSQKSLCEYIINSFDDDGYLRMSNDDLLDNLAFYHNLFIDESELQDAVETIQSLDPPGIGARNLQECLLLQLESKHAKTECIQAAFEIVKSHLQDLAQKSYVKIQHQLHLSETELKCAIQLIQKLNPKPVGLNSTAQTKSQQIIPEFVIERIDSDKLNISLATQQVQIKLNKEKVEELDKQKSIKRAGKSQKAALQYLQSKFDSAKWLMEMIHQRENNMLDVMKSIVLFQKKFFLTGDRNDLKPMVLKDIADLTGLNASTISRVTSSKYALTDFGVISLKSLFQQAMSKSDGKQVTNQEIMARLKELVDAESKLEPLSDLQIAVELEKSGYPIARRTVAKYREILKIENANNRKQNF